MGDEQVLGVTKVVNALFGKLAAHRGARAAAHQAGRIRSIRLRIPSRWSSWSFCSPCCSFPVVQAAHFALIVPGATQQTMEFVITNPMGVGVKDLMDDIVGHGADRHIPLLVATIGIFILFSNMISLVPGFSSPTATITVTLGLRHHRFPVLQRHRHRKACRSFRYAKDAAGAHAQAISDQHHYAHCRDRQPFRAAAFALRPALGQHDGQRASLCFPFLALSLSLCRFCQPREERPSGYISGVVPIAIPACYWPCCTFSWLYCRRSFLAILAIVYLGLASAEEH